MKKFCFLLLFSLLSGCTLQSPCAYQRQLDTWMGVPAQKLINSQWGIPTRTFISRKGNKVYCYIQRTYYQTPVVYTPVFYGHFPFTPGLGGQIVNVFCRTCFILNKHKVITDYTYRGSNCIANPAFRFQDFYYQYGQFQERVSRNN